LAHEEEVKMIEKNLEMLQPALQLGQKLWKQDETYDD